MILIDSPKDFGARIRPFHLLTLRRRESARQLQSSPGPEEGRRSDSDPVHGFPEYLQPCGRRAGESVRSRQRPLQRGPGSLATAGSPGLRGPFLGHLDR